MLGGTGTGSKLGRGPLDTVWQLAASESAAAAIAATSTAGARSDGEPWAPRPRNPLPAEPRSRPHRSRLPVRHHRSRISRYPLDWSSQPASASSMLSNPSPRPGRHGGLSAIVRALRYLRRWRKRDQGRLADTPPAPEILL
jgi:hypothetical protein